MATLQSRSPSDHKRLLFAPEAHAQVVIRHRCARAVATFAADFTAEVGCANLFVDSLHPGFACCKVDLPAAIKLA